MLSLLLRNLLFTILQPGVVVGLLPYLILREGMQRIVIRELSNVQLISVFLFAAGLILMLYCIYLFARVGKGTLSPADRTKHLVDRGIYRYSRNPMYVGVMAMLMAEAMFFGHGPLWIYVALVFVAFNIFIVAIEEPRLEKDFGEVYKAYCKKVRRWL